MKTYKVLNGGHSKQFSTWWEMIGYLKNIGFEKRYSHNGRDDYRHYWNFYDSDIVQCDITKRDVCAFENDVIINLSEIRKAVDNYVEQLRYRRKQKAFRFRYDPIPSWQNHCRKANYKKPRHNYRNNLATVYDLDSARIRNQIKNTTSWWDDEEYRKPQRSWKEHRKTQWR